MTAVRHGIRVSFNLSVCWTAPPLRGRGGGDLSLLEASLLAPLDRRARALWRREAEA